MSIHDKLLTFRLVVGICICIAPSSVSAAVIYSNDFESGLPVIVNDMEGPRTNGYCYLGGATNPFTSFTGCVSVVPTSSIGAGSGSYVAWANPNQPDIGTVPGSTLNIQPPGLVDGWHGSYEVSFKGAGIQQLVFLDVVWAYTLGACDYTFGGCSGYTVDPGEVEDYSVTFDFDERTKYYVDTYGSNSADTAYVTLCPSEEFECGFSTWTFAIASGGWIDDIEVNYLGTGQGSTPVPEPGTLGLLLTGLIAAGTLRLCKPRQIDASSRMTSVLLEDC